MMNSRIALKAFAAAQTAPGVCAHGSQKGMVNPWLNPCCSKFKSRMM